MDPERKESRLWLHTCATAPPRPYYIFSSLVKKLYRKRVGTNETSVVLSNNIRSKLRKVHKYITYHLPQAAHNKEKSSKINQKNQNKRSAHFKIPYPNRFEHIPTNPSHNSGRGTTQLA